MNNAGLRNAGLRMGVQRAARDQFRAHNGTEGFGLVGEARPTCLCTLVSGGESSPYATIVFHTLTAAGVFLRISLMYVSAMVLSLISGIRS
jgi:hypothetical protein